VTTRALVPLAGLVALAAGCVGNPPRSQFPTADDALGRMHASYECVNGIQSRAKIDHSSPKGRVRAEIEALTENPDHVRFDVYSPVGADLLYILASDGKEFQLYDKLRNEYVVGKSKACNLARLTQVPVPGHALVSLLRGEAPVLVHGKDNASIDWLDKKNVYRLQIASTQGASEEIHLEVPDHSWEKEWKEQRVRVRYVKVVQKGYVLYEADLANHEARKRAAGWTDPDGIEDPVPPNGPECNAELPHSIHMRVPATAEDVIFQFKTGNNNKAPSWSPPILKNAFKVIQPPGSNKVPVDCED